MNDIIKRFLIPDDDGGGGATTTEPDLDKQSEPEFDESQFKEEFQKRWSSTPYEGDDDDPPPIALPDTDDEYKKEVLKDTSKVSEDLTKRSEQTKLSYDMAFDNAVDYSKNYLAEAGIEGPEADAILANVKSQIRQTAIDHGMEQTIKLLKNNAVKSAINSIIGERAVLDRAITRAKSSRVPSSTSASEIDLPLYNKNLELYTTAYRRNPTDSEKQWLKDLARKGQTFSTDI